MSGMFERSRAFLFVKDSAATVLTRLGRHLARWGFAPLDRLPAGYRPGSQEVRQLWWRGPSEACAWTCLAIADIENTFSTAYALARSAPEVPVLASRAYVGGTWQLKAYHMEDCVVKVGDDPDHELAWIGLPLDRESVPRVAAILGGGSATSAFLEGVVDGRPAPEELVAALALPPLDIGFDELSAGPGAGWRRAMWVHRSSPLAG